MTEFTRQALDHLARHHGVADAASLHDAGMSTHAIRELVGAGNLEPVLRGAYRMPAVPLDELARCAAVCTAHPELTIAGPTAGRLWGFRRLPADRRIHVLAPPASHPSIADWVVAYRTTAYHDDDLVRRPDGIVVTSRPRTAFDLARHLAPPDLLSVIEQAMRDGGHSSDEMYRVAIDWASRGRPWARRFLRVLDGRVVGGAAESHFEVMLGDALVRAGVHGLQRQYAIELPGYGRARFDLAVPARRVAIEVDVFPTHHETAGRSKDRRRDDAAASIGWTVERVDETGFGDALGATVGLLRQVLDRHPPR